MRVSAILAATLQGGIGCKGALPWKPGTLPEDMVRFKALTTGKAVLMGRVTWDSLPAKFRPLPDRVNIVISSTMPAGVDESTGVVTVGSVEEGLRAAENASVDEAFLIGGRSLYTRAFAGLASRIYLTSVAKSFDADTFVPLPDVTASPRWRLHERVRANDRDVCFDVYERVHEEEQYLDLIRRCLDFGSDRGDRTGTGTLSTFGASMRFSLRDGAFPLLTTKRVFWRAVVEELLWFISGSTDARILQDKGIKIWDGNSSRAYLDSIGLAEREEGDLGPVYGFQWRHFGADYTDFHASYDGQGVDQLAAVIRTIRERPTDRRIVLSAWNPLALPLMALPPCHMFCQFYVDDAGRLSCQMYQRSADMGLGVPFNIASYSLLTYLVARVTGLEPGEFVHVIGDAHVYKNHVEPLRKQLENEPRPFPKFVWKRDGAIDDIDSITADDFELQGYSPHAKIEMKMAV